MATCCSLLNLLCYRVAHVLNRTYFNFIENLNNWENVLIKQKSNKIPPQSWLLSTQKTNNVLLALDF